MKNHALLKARAYLLSLIALLSGYVLLIAPNGRRAEAKIDVRIFTPSPQDTLRLRKFDFKLIKKNGGKYIDASVSENQLLELRKSGFQIAMISGHSRNSTITASYKSYGEIETKLHVLQLRYPDILIIEQIGESTALGLPIWAVKISDNAIHQEDEPRILFTGVHHAREPIGANICLNLVQTLCENYGQDNKITNWVESIEIWFVPVVNPDGYKYVLENNIRFPWWRKNLHDNNGDGIFDPLYDGVDLNRNYGYNWDEGGDGKTSSWFYRGTQPFSEKETQAIKNLVIRENFVIGISYHSYGESILFPWGNFKQPPDLDLIVDIASKMASKMKRQSGRGQYSILPLNGRVGQSSIWMYGQLRVFDYIVEAGTEYFPSDESIPFIMKENLKGAYYLFDRLLETGIRGHIFDAYTKEPLFAEVQVKEFSADYVKSRVTDPQFGMFYRLIKPGYYTLEIKSRGYYRKIIENVRVVKGKIVDLEIGLYRKSNDVTNGRK
ncbi:MAG: M14 family zinc carboxypeptidase [bacterium]